MTAVRPDLIFATPFNLQRIAFEVIRPLFYISATIMLFRPDANAWFSRRREPKDLGDVFQ
jgi:hypothetical protein